MKVNRWNRYHFFTTFDRDTISWKTGAYKQEQRKNDLRAQNRDISLDCIIFKFGYSNTRADRKTVLSANNLGKESQFTR